MPYSEALDARLAVQTRRDNAERRRMFGGTCYLVGGNMLCGVWKDHLILRLGADAAAAALERPGVRPFDVTGRPMRGWVMVGEESLTDAALADWLNLARAFVATLPAKS